MFDCRRFTPLLAIAVAALTGCATLFNPGPDEVNVSSDPPGARVFVDGQEVGRTPTVVALDRGRNQGSIRVEAAGYQPVATQRAKRFNTIAILNCLGLLPWVIDLVTGNYQRFDTTPLHVNLVPAGHGPPAAGQPDPGAVLPPPTATAPPPGRTDPAAASAVNEEGKTLYRAGEYAGAAAKFQQAVQLSPEARYYYNLCAALEMTGDLAGALRACAEVYARGPDDKLRTKTDERMDRIRAKQRGQ